MQDREEWIGKVKLDLTHYGGKDLYCDGEVEDELLSIVQDYAPEDYQKLIGERLAWPILYHLSDIRENIVDWLRLKKGAKVLEVGSGCGAISGALSKKAGRLDCVELSKKRSLINAHRHKDAENICIHVGNFEDIEPGLDGDYDAIFLIGVFEYAASYIHDKDPYGSFLRIIKKHLRPGGSIVIAIENRLGMKYFGGAREDHLGQYFSGIEDYPQGGVVRTFSRPALEKLLQKEEMGEYHFYYPYPDYKFMLQLYSDRRLPLEGELGMNRLCLDRDRLSLFNEANAYDALLRDGLFPVFSNSYLLVIGPEPETIYSKYSNDRAPQYAIRTDILERAGERLVEKYPMDPRARAHVQKQPELEKLLRKRFDGSALSVCPAQLTEDGEGVRFPYIAGRTMEELLAAAVKEKDAEKIMELLEQYKSFEEYHSSFEADNPDMQLSNLILGGDGWTLIDYEWTVEAKPDPHKNMERAMYLFTEYDAAGSKLSNSLLDAVMPGVLSGMDRKALWLKEREFQKKVTGERLSLGEINELMANPIRDVCVEKPQRHELLPQVYFDRGSGFSEADSIWPVAKALPDGSREVQIFAEEDVKAIRFDPCRCPCVLQIVSIDGEAVKEGIYRKCRTEGIVVEKNSCYFDHDDPNMTIPLRRGGGNLRIRYRIKEVRDPWEE